MTSHTELFTRVVDAELNAWVPDASQRLLHRAGARLGFTRPDPATTLPDCGPYVSNHATVPNWVGHVYVLDCVNCARIFRA